MKIKALCLTITCLMLFGCENPKDVNYSFFVAGHTYGKPGRTELGLCDEFKNKFSLINNNETIRFGVLTGDIVKHANDESWNAVDEDIKEINADVYFARGNHDGDLSFFEKRYGETYSAFVLENDIHIILDSNISGWNIEGEQLAFLKKTIKNNSALTGNIYIYSHHIIWYDKGYNTPAANSLDRKSETLTYWADLHPYLMSIKKPIYLFAGDVGAFDGTKDNVNDRYKSFSHIEKDNVTLITSGMGGGKQDNFIIVEVLNNNTTKFKLIHLNGSSISSLGKLEDYKMSN